jgi:hypothetical protein
MPTWISATLNKSGIVHLIVINKDQAAAGTLEGNAGDNGILPGGQIS